MTYASVSRGFRGGGFNAVTAPFRTYKGDSAWTYEIGTKYSEGRRLSLAGAIFYNNYSDYIGLNQFVLGTDGRPVTVDLNTGDVDSYGAEIEASFRPTRQWTISGGASYVHARVTDSDIYTETTGKVLGSKRLPFQPDWTFNIASDYVVPIGKGELDFYTGVVAKGSRIGASLSETRVPVLKSYALVNGALTYRLGGFEIGAFVNNAFDKKYFDSFIEQTTLANAFCPGGLAGCPNAPLVSDLGIMGEGRRYGVRTRFRF
jgi:iron complex outermembrane receptor protein